MVADLVSFGLSFCYLTTHDHERISFVARQDIIGCWIGSDNSLGAVTSNTLKSEAKGHRG